MYPILDIVDMYTYSLVWIRLDLNSNGFTVKCSPSYNTFEAQLVDTPTLIKQIKLHLHFVLKDHYFS